MNSILPTLFQFFFLVVVIIAFVAAVKVFRRSLAPKISQEWRAISLLGMLSLMALFSTMLYLNIATWQGAVESTEVRTGEILTANLDEDEKKYLTKVYEPLGKSYEQLSKSIIDMKEFSIMLTELNDAHPNHSKLLSKIVERSSKEGAEQRKLFNRVHREIRYAMIQSRKTERQDDEKVYIDQRFAERAKILNSDLEKRQKNTNIMFTKLASSLESSLNEARKILIRGNAKVSRKDSNHSFSRETQNTLSSFLREKDADTDKLISVIEEQIQNAERKKERMRDLSMQYKDLAQPLIKTMNLWQQAEQSARRHRNDLLYAIEAMYLVGKFKMPDRNPAYHSLFKTLKKQSRRKEELIEKKRVEVEKSFISPGYVKKT